MLRSRKWIIAGVSLGVVSVIFRIAGLVTDTLFYEVAALVCGASTMLCIMVAMHHVYTEKPRVDKQDEKQ